MKKLIISILLACIATVSFSKEEVVCLRKATQGSGKEYNHPPRSTTAIIIRKDDHTLTIPQHGGNVRVVLSQGGEIIFENTISSTAVNTIDISENINGDCILQLFIDDTLYVGNIYF